MKLVKNVMLIVCVLFLVAACFDDDDEEEVGEGWPELQGVWQSDCFVFDDTPQIQTFDVDGDQGENGVEIYADDDTSCSGTTVFETTINYRYEVGDEVQTDDGVTAREIDVEVLEDPDDVAEHDEEFDIFHINDGGNTLYFSADAAPNEADRPNSLDFDRPYTKISD